MLLHLSSAGDFGHGASAESSKTRPHPNSGKEKKKKKEITQQLKKINKSKMHTQNSAGRVRARHSPALPEGRGKPGECGLRSPCSLQFSRDVWGRGGTNRTQDRLTQAGSALLIIPLSKRRRERGKPACRREPPAANFPSSASAVRCDRRSAG